MGSSNRIPKSRCFTSAHHSFPFALQFWTFWLAAFLFQIFSSCSSSGLLRFEVLVTKNQAGKDEVDDAIIH